MLEMDMVPFLYGWTAVYTKSYKDRSVDRRGSGEPDRRDIILEGEHKRQRWSRRFTQVVVEVPHGDHK